MAQAQQVTIVASPEQIRQNLVVAMQAYYTSFPRNNAPDLSNFDTAYPTFLKDLQKNINRFNKDEASIDGDESSAFRQMWNNAAPGTPLTQKNQSVLQENGLLDTKTAEAFNRFVRFSNEDRSSLATNFNKTGSAIPVLNEALQAVLLDQQMQRAATASMEMIDPALVSAELDKHIAQIQTHFGLKATGELTPETQKLINITIRANNIPLKGTIANDSNAAALLQEQLQKRVDELRQEQLDEFDRSKSAEQTNIIKDAGFSAHDAETIIDLLDKSETKDIAKRNLQDTISANPKLKDNLAKDQFVDLLWVLEAQEQLNAKDWSGNVIAQLSNDERTLFSINNVLQHIHAQDGQAPKNTLETIAGANKAASDAANDSFFRPEVYDAIKAQKAIDGNFLPEPYKEPGHMYSPQDIAEIAYDLMQKRLAENNIAPQNLTKSILEGDFAPRFEDLKLVQESFGRPSLEEILADPYYKSELAIMINIGMIKVPASSQTKYGFDPDNNTHGDCLKLLERMDLNDNLSNHIAQTIETAPNYVLGNIINVHQSRSMNSKFGSFKDVGTVTTTRHFADKDGEFQPQEAQLEGADFAINILARHGNAHFNSMYGIDADTAHHVVENKLRLPQDLQDAIDRVMDSTSVVSYFQTGEGFRNISSVNFRADYAVMRDKYVEEKILPAAEVSLPEVQTATAAPST